MFLSYPQIAIADLNEAYDYIIVGGGTAGCVLANRLSEDPDVSVLLLERGGPQDKWISYVPLLSSHFASDGSRSRVWQSTPQKHANGRVIDLVGGNSLGGSSRVNAMLYTRGLPAEYNSWSAAGHKGWSYANMQQYFVKSETDLDQGRTGVDDYHGKSGEWPNRSHNKSYWKHTGHIIEATTALGVPYVDDLNSPLHPSHGCAKMHYNIDRNGRRSSTFTAFLPPKLAKTRKQHLHICTHTIVPRIEITGEDGLARAEGVWVKPHDGSLPTRFVRANREVILSAGPIGSPQTLLLSGIGPEHHLKEHDIPVMKDLPGVGSSLQDHIMVPVQYRVPVNDSLLKLQLRPWIFIKEFILFLLFGTGLLLAPVIELSIFVQSRLFDSNHRVVTPSKVDADAALPTNLPDIEVMPISWGDVARYREGGLSFFTVPLRPTSTGTVRLASSDPLDAPIIDPNYLATERDRRVLREGIKFTLRIKDQMVLQKYPIIDSYLPASESDDDIDRFVREELQSTNHYTSTCRMAPENPQNSSDGLLKGVVGGVVDDRLRVHGVKALRVADSSVFPHILSTHLAAGTVAIAEKCADMIKEDYGRWGEILEREETLEDSVY